MKEKIPNNIAIKFLPHFPTVLIGTGEDEDANLITAAMLHVFSIDPPYLGTGISPKRHSFKLLEDNPEFTVNVPTTELKEEIMGCGKVSGRDHDKYKKYGLTKEESKNISTPGIEEFPLTIECKVVKQVETGDHNWFVGEVVNARKDEDFDREDTIMYWGGEFRIPGKVIDIK